jgi:NAD(P)-dependent dehydrogenase (short-subunit alcohol dehydrogenase family)
VQLQEKNAIVYGAAGSMGSAVARAFAREGRGAGLGFDGVAWAN